MTLIYLSEPNLRDRLFLKEFASAFSIKEKAIVIHSSYNESISDTRYVSKRISALLSEAMIYNNAFSADQRQFFSIDNDLIRINKSLIDTLLDPIQLLIFNPVVAVEGNASLADPIRLLLAAREEFHAEDVIMFPDNPMSALGMENAVINSLEDKERLIAVYEEEKAIIEIAYRLRPARIASPNNYSSDSKV